MIKKETGQEREFNTGAKKQAAKNKGTPVLFPPDAYLEVCKHFEEGAGHYGPRNWEKGIPLSELINSCERHIAQEKMGLTDESHDRAFVWCAVVYLATKLRIKAGILPKELDDLCGAYGDKLVAIPPYIATPPVAYSAEKAPIIVDACDLTEADRRTSGFEKGGD